MVQKLKMKRYCVYLLRFTVVFYLCFILLQYSNKSNLKLLFDSLDDDVSSKLKSNVKGYYYSTLQTSQIDRLKAEINRRSTIPSSRLISGNTSHLAPILLVVVCSHPSHVHNRLTIRNTWAFNFSKQISVVFLIGKVKDDSWNSVIRRESLIHKDIVKVDVIETYRNLTVKMMAGFKAILTQFQFVKYILKTDDDTFINLPYLLRELNTNINFVPADQVVGALCIKSRVIRDPRDVWFVPYSIYSNSTYPPYVHGGAYLLQYSTLNKLLSYSISPYLQLEDVYITGILSRDSGIIPVSHRAFSFWNSKPASVCDIIQNKLISSVNLQMKQILKLYNGIRQKSVRKCESIHQQLSLQNT